MMKAISNLLDQLSVRLGKSIAWLILLMMFMTATVVVMRYFLNVGSIALQEAILYLHGCVIMLGIGYTLKTNGHVRVDVLNRRFNPRQKAWVELLGCCLFLVPLSIFILVTSLPYVAFSWSVLESSGAPGGLPGVFILKTLIPLMAVLLFLQGISEAIKAWQRLRKR